MPQAWLIIGASRGIGLEFTSHLLSLNHTVLATYRSPTPPPTLTTLSQTPNGKNNLTLLRCDVSDENSIKAFTEEVRGLGKKGGVLEGGVIDVVVLNAGVLVYPGGISDISFSSFTHQLTTNTIGPLLTASHLLALSAPSRDDDEVTSIHIKTLVFISSDSGSAQKFLAYEDGFGAYAASKAALNQGLRHLAAEMYRKTSSSMSSSQEGEKGKRKRTVVLALHPSEVSTDMAADVDLPWEVEGVIGVEESVRSMVGVIGEKGWGGSDEGGGEDGAATFWTWEGRRYPW